MKRATLHRILAAGTALLLTAKAVCISADTQQDFFFRVGFINIDDSNNVCYPAAQNFREYVENDQFAASIGADHVEVLLGDSQSDVEKQTSVTETMLVKGVDMLFIIGVDTAGNTTAVTACNDEDVPVFLVGTESDGGDWRFIGFDETELGRYQGEWCVDNLPENARICYLEGTPGREATIMRKQGFETALSKRPDLVLLSSHSGDFRASEAMKVTEDWIQAYGDEIDCIVAADGQMILGAIEALKGAQLLDSVKTCGVIASDSEIYLMEEGSLDYAVFVYWPEIGTLCGEVARKMYLGEEPEERTNIKLHHMTSSNYKELLAEYDD